MGSYTPNPTQSTVAMYILINVSVMFLMLFVDSENRDACRI